MKEVSNSTYYKCDFCNKKLFRKWAMVSHEQKCSSNPANNRPCLNCNFLQRVPAKYDTGISDYHNGDPVMKDFSAFRCSKLDKIMSHPTVDFFSHKHLLSWVEVKGVEVEQVQMPNSCDEYEWESNLDFSSESNFF